MFGYTARHLKAKVVEKSSEDACSKVDQTFEMDGWYADLEAKSRRAAPRRWRRPSAKPRDARTRLSNTTAAAASRAIPSCRT